MGLHTVPFDYGTLVIIKVKMLEGSIPVVLSNWCIDAVKRHYAGQSYVKELQ
jgi:hypothetical protein